MALNIFTITCPGACEAAGTLGVLPETICQLAPKLSEIDLLLFQGTDAGPTDASSASDWTGLVDNTDNTGANFKYLIGSGQITRPEATTQTVARGQVLTTKQTYTLEFEVYEFSEASVYDFIRTLQCGALKPKFMYADRGGFLYFKKKASAPDEGIVPTSVQAYFDRPRGDGSIAKAVIEIKYEALVDPDRAVNPLTL